MPTSPNLDHYFSVHTKKDSFPKLQYNQLMVIKDQFFNNDIKICQPILLRIPANVQKYK